MDRLHEDSVRGVISAMRTGETRRFPVRRLLYVKNMMSVLNTTYYGVHRWASEVRRKEGVIVIRKIC